MSKLLVLLLLALNLVLGLLIWQDSKTEAPVIVPGGDIQLLSEVEPAAEPAEEDSLLAAQEEPEAAPEPEPTPAPAKKAPEPPEALAKPPPKAAAKPKAPTTIHCYRYGPVDSRLSAIGILARFKESGQKQKIIEEAANSRFWLLAKGGTDLAKLQSMSLGDHQGSHILGIFTTRAQAQAQMKEFQATGANLSIEEIKSDKSKFWVLFGSSKANLDLKALDQQIPKGNLIKSKQCP